MIWLLLAINIGLLWWLMIARYRVRLLRKAMGGIIELAVQSKHDLLLEKGLMHFLRSQEKNLEKQVLAHRKEKLYEKKGKADSRKNMGKADD